MNTEVITKSQHFIQIDGVEYGVRLAPERGTDIEHQKQPDGGMLIGYLIQDGDCSSPEDADGVGAIRSLSRRHTNRIEHAEAVELLNTDKMVVPLSYFEHGQCLWGVNGTMSGMPDFRWDGVDFAGVWIPDDCCRDEIKSRSHRKHITYNAAARELAVEACKSYTAWCNGDCWGVIVVTCAKDGTMLDSDECWGFVGHEWAIEALKEEMSSTATHLKKGQP